MGETQFLLFISIFEKCLEIGETQFLLVIDTFKKCLEMGETQFLLLISWKVSRKGRNVVYPLHKLALTTN